MTGAFKCLLRNHLSAHTSSLRLTRGISSAGRAPALQAGGQRFDPAMLHQKQGSLLPTLNMRQAALHSKGAESIVRVFVGSC